MDEDDIAGAVLSVYGPSGCRLPFRAGQAFAGWPNPSRFGKFGSIDQRQQIRYFTAKFEESVPDDPYIG